MRRGRPDCELNPPAAEYIQGLSRPGEAKLLATIAHYRLLPESYIYGLADVRMISDFYASYLLGKPYPHGVWFYFPSPWLIKSTVPFLVLLGISVWAICAAGCPRREVWFLTLPPALYLAVAMSAHMNIGMRHVLPMYAFLTVLEAGAAIALARASRDWLYVVVVLLAFQIITSVKAYPEYIPYANELWGGSSQTYKLLSDSNADWGQQLKATSRYLRERGRQGLLVLVLCRRRRAVPVLRNSVQAAADARCPVGRREVRHAGGDRRPGADQRQQPLRVRVRAGRVESVCAVPAVEANGGDPERGLRLRRALRNSHGGGDRAHARRPMNYWPRNASTKRWRKRSRRWRWLRRSVRANVMLGDVLTAMGQKDEARQVLRESADAGADGRTGVPSGMGGE